MTRGGPAAKVQLTRPQGLRKRREFLRVQGSARRFRGKLLVLLLAPSPESDISAPNISAPKGRVGYTVSRKVGGAVIRNSVRRRLREIIRTHPESLCSGFDYVVVALPRAKEVTFLLLQQDLLQLLGSAARWASGRGY